MYQEGEVKLCNVRSARKHFLYLLFVGKIKFYILMNKLIIEQFESVEIYKLFHSPNCLSLHREKLGKNMPNFKRITHDDFGVEEIYRLNGWFNLYEFRKLVNSLPKGKEIRSHTPEYGLKITYSHDEAIELTISWSDNSINIQQGSKSSDQCFDGQSSKAKKLKAMIDNATK